MPSIDELVIKIKADVDGLVSGLEQAKSEISSFGTSVNEISKQGKVIAGAFAAIGGAVLYTTDKFMDMNKSIEKVGVISKASTAELDEMRRSAMALSDGIFSTSQLASGYETLAREGIKVADSMKIMPELVNLAKASNVDLNNVIGITTDLLQGYKLSLDDVGKVSDIITMISTQTGDSFAEVSSSLAGLAPIASAVGMKIEDVAGLLMAFGNEGMKVTEANAALSFAMRSLVNPSREIEDAFGAIGIAMRNQEGKMRPFGDILGELSGRFQEMPDGPEKASLAVQLFGRQSSEMLAILNKGPATLKLSGEAIKESTGLTNEMAAAVNRNISPMGRLKDKFDDIIMSVGGSLAPFADGAAAISGIGMAIGGTMMGLPGLVKGFEMLKGLSLAGMAASVTSAITTITTAISAAGAFLLANPIFLAIAAIIAAVIALKYAWDNNLGGIQEKTKAVLGWITDKWDAFTGFLSGISIEGIKNKIVGGYENLKSGISEKIGGIIGGVRQFASDHERELKIIGGAILTVATGGAWLAWKHNWFGVRDSAVEAWEGIKTKTAELAEWLAAKWEEIKSAAGGAWEALKNAISEKWEAIKTTVSDAITAIVNFFTPYYEQLKSVGSMLFTKLKEGLELAYNTFVKPYVDIVTGAISSALDFGTRAYDWGKNLLSNFIDGIKSMFSNLRSTLFDFASQVAEYIRIRSPAKTGPLSELLEWGPNLVKTYADGIKNAMPVLNSAFAGLSPEDNKLKIDVEVNTDNLEKMIKEAIDATVNVEGIQIRSNVAPAQTKINVEVNTSNLEKTIKEAIDAAAPQAIHQTHNWSIRIEKIENKADADYLVREIERRIVKKTAAGIL